MVAGFTGPLLSPFVGALLDRLGGRRVILVGIVLFALVTAAQSLLTSVYAKNGIRRITRRLDRRE